MHGMKMRAVVICLFENTIIFKNRSLVLNFGCLVELVSGLSLVPHDFVVSVELQQSLCWGYVGDVLRENLGFSWGGF